MPSFFSLLYLCQCLVNKAHYTQKTEIVMYSKRKTKNKNPCLKMSQVAHERTLRDEQYTENQATWSTKDLQCQHTLSSRAWLHFLNKMQVSSDLVIVTLVGGPVITFGLVPWSSELPQPPGATLHFQVHPNPSQYHARALGSIHTGEETRPEKTGPAQVRRGIMEVHRYVTVKMIKSALLSFLD